MSLFLIVVMCSLSVTAGAAEEEVVTFEESNWSNTIYYIASLAGEYGARGSSSYQDITLSITAVEDYELYVNGDQYDDQNDGDWTTVDTYNINLGGANEIRIGIKVDNPGRGNGNGVIVGITNAGTDQLGTWLKKKESVFVDNTWKLVPVAWWTFDEDDKAELEFGDDWYDFNTDLFTDLNKRKLMRRALEGEINTDLDVAFPPGVIPITGYFGSTDGSGSSDVDTGTADGGGIKLRRIEGENIALNKPAENLELTNGAIITNPLTINQPLNDTRYIDLGRIYRVNQMTIFTGGDNPVEYEQKSIRGYAVEVSLDNYRYEEVGIIHDIGIPDENGNVNEGGFDNYSVEFPDEWVRYIQFKITEVRPTGTPSIGEVMVFGIGYVFDGEYISDWLDFGAPDAVKNFGMVEWTGKVPDGTKITVQTQTRNADGDPSPWSEEMTASSFAFPSPEPATHFRYRVNLSTQDIDKTPVFNSISVDYSLTDQPLSFAEGYITPENVAMGENTEFVYTLAYKLSGAQQDIDQVAISVPGNATLNYISSSATGGELSANGTMAGLDTLLVSLDTPLTNTGLGADPDTLYISFNTQLLKSYHTFDAYIFNSGGNDGAGGMKVWKNASLSNIATVDRLLESLLMDVEAVPKVFVPTNDGVNQFAVIEFRLAKVSTNVLINIYNTDGMLVTTIHDDYIDAGDYTARRGRGRNDNELLPGFWDGTDEDGDLVPPGIYVYQVVAETDDDDVVENGTIVVAY